MSSIYILTSLPQTTNETSQRDFRKRNIGSRPAFKTAQLVYYVVQMSCRTFSEMGNLIGQSRYKLSPNMLDATFMIKDRAYEEYEQLIKLQEQFDQADKNQEVQQIIKKVHKKQQLLLCWEYILDSIHILKL
ncbi:Hypothetical_protein [Hexamita inflata]|uniref:Hypothetical_protein n=1 Tax=Hexamita inflata TaxID=28002 RepID=A0ABP1JIW6_9EUKA